MLARDGTFVCIYGHIVIVHHILNVLHIVVENANLRLEEGNVCIGFGLRLDEILHNLVIVLREEPIDLILLEPQPLHILHIVIQATMEQVLILLHIVDLLL